MEKHEFDQLVANLKRDGVLMSLPVVYRGTVYSGNHRVQAAIKAGIEEADCIEILSEMAEDELLAIQLSHNSIAGKDDPNILAKLFTSIRSLDLKAYSGLTDDQFKLDDASLASMGIRRPKYEELQVVFLPEDHAAFVELLERIEKLARKPTVVAGQLAGFDAFFDAIVQLKGKRNILNNAAALLEMARITHQVLEAEEEKRAAA